MTFQQNLKFSFEKANPSGIVDLCYDFHLKYYPNVRFLVDGSNAGFVRHN